MSDPEKVLVSEPPIILRLVRMVNGLSGRDIKRWRIAVTAEEWEQMREYLLVREGRWWSRVRDIPLIIEDHPDDPAYAFEQAPGAPIGDSHG